MFTGIVETLGTVEAIDTHGGGDVRLAIAAGGDGLRAIAAGESIAVNGVCLTAVAPGRGGFAADASRETLALTTLGGLRVGDRVNLETALRAGEPMGGHLVTGHVDGIGEVAALEPDARSWRLELALPRALARYVARKGSICVDGVSLTVNDVGDAGFGVNIVPHTREATIIRDYREGRRVNLEVDLIARYLERLLGAGAPAPGDTTARQEAGDDTSDH